MGVSGEKKVNVMLSNAFRLLKKYFKNIFLIHNNYKIKKTKYREFKEHYSELTGSNNGYRPNG